MCISGLSTTYQMVAGKVTKVNAATFHFDAARSICHLRLELSGGAAVRLNEMLDARTLRHPLPTRTLGNHFFLQRAQKYFRLPAASVRCQTCLRPELCQPRGSTPHLEQAVGPKVEPGLFRNRNERKNSGTRMMQKTAVTMPTEIFLSERTANNSQGLHSRAAAKASAFPASLKRLLQNNF